MTQLLLLATLLSPAPREEVDFQRVYVAKDKASYTVIMTVAKTEMKAEIDAVVESVQPGFAMVNYKATALEFGGLGNKSSLPNLSTKVGGQNMPNAANILNAEEFFIFLGIAGITPGSKATVGGDVKVSWENDRKDVSVRGSGKVLESNAAAKTLTVQWNLAVTAPKGPEMTWKLKSVYSAKDFSLISSEGPIEGMGVEASMKVTKRS